MDAFSILDVVACVNTNKVAEFHSQVVPRHLVQLDATLFDVVRADTNQDRVLSLLSP